MLLDTEEVPQLGKGEVPLLTSDDPIDEEDWSYELRGVPPDLARARTVDKESQKDLVSTLWMG